MSAQRSPNFPPRTTITRSPGERVFTTAPSIAPVPDAANIRTSFCALEEQSKVPAHVGEEGFVLGRSVVDHGLRHRQKHGGRDRRGPRGEQVLLHGRPPLVGFAHRECPDRGADQTKKPGREGAPGRVSATNELPTRNITSVPRHVKAIPGVRRPEASERGSGDICRQGIWREGSIADRIRTLTFLIAYTNIALSARDENRLHAV